MVEDREIVRVTSQAWCDQLAEKLLQTKLSEGYHSEMRSGKRTVVVEQINVSGKKLDPYADMQRYVDGDQPVPVWIRAARWPNTNPKRRQAYSSRTVGCRKGQRHFLLVGHGPIASS